MNETNEEWISLFNSLYYPNRQKNFSQNISSSDKPIAVGSCVMVQTGGGYQRVLPVDDKDLCKTVKEHHKRKHKHKKEEDDEDDDNGENGD